MAQREFAVAVLLIMIVPLFAGCTEEPNKAPVAVFTADPPKINAGETVYFSANDSIDKDGKIAKYHWDFGDGSWDNQPYTEHTYEDGGTYTVDLVVTDDGGAKDHTNTTIHVNEWPKAQGNVAKDPVKINEVVQFDGSFSSDTDGDIICYSWDFGDGSREAEGPKPSHSYGKLGVFNITLLVEDNDGATDLHKFQLEVVKRKYKVYWNESKTVLDTISDYTNENETTNKTTEVDTLNLTKLVFEMKWSDHIPVVGAANDNFELMVRSPPPDDDIKKVATTNESIEHKFTIDYLPSELTVDAINEAQVQNDLIADYTSDKGNGEWKIQVKCLEAGDWYLDQFELDGGNDWEITVTAYFYTATIVEIC